MFTQRMLSFIQVVVRLRLASLVALLVLILATLMVRLDVEAHAPDVSLTGFGTATVDGVIDAEEWMEAGSIVFPVNLPGGDTTPGTLFVMNDEINLYLAVEFDAVASGNTAVFEFDNDHDGGARVNGDDVILRNTTDFFDEVRTNAPPCSPDSGPAACGLLDTTVGGTNDGAGAFNNAGGVTRYEFSHPLG